jgi:predicted Zn-ribbon and HTH transcriptional regulator
MKYRLLYLDRECKKCGKKIERDVWVHDHKYMLMSAYCEKCTFEIIDESVPITAIFTGEIVTPFLYDEEKRRFVPLLRKEVFQKEEMG